MRQALGASKPSHRQQLATWAAITTIAAWLVFLFDVSASRAMHFDGPEADGPFQLFNLLRRVAAGQRPGADFPVFHGVGIPYVHYPLFRLFGGDLHASELARSALPVFLHVLAVVVFMRAWTRRWSIALWCTAGVLMYPAAVLTTLYLPGNSAIGMRSVAPVFLAAVLVGVTHRLTRIAFAGVLLAVALLLGVEQGAAAAAAIIGGVAVSVFASTKLRPQRVWLDAAAILGIGVSGFLVAVLLLAGPDGAPAVLGYQFRDLPQDQIWYFGVPPSRFIGRWSDLAELWWVGALLVVAAALIVQLWRESTAGVDAPRAVGGTVLLLSGAISCMSFLGISAVKYGAPLFRAVVMVAAAVAATHLLRDASSQGPLARRITAAMKSPPAQLAGHAFCIMCLVVGIFTFGTSAFSAARSMGSPRLSARLERDLAIGQSVLRSIGHPSDVRLWSTYAGLLESHLGKLHPSTDYIIHALGTDGRVEYLRQFDAFDPDVVQTVRPSQFHGYEEWLQTTTWPFYERLLDRYTVASLTSKAILWKRRVTPDRDVNGNATRPIPRATRVNMWDAGDSTGNVPVVLSLPGMPEGREDGAGADRLRVVIVDLEYEATNPWRIAPLVGQTPRFFVRVGNARNRLPVSLPPQGRSVRFPVYVHHHGENAAVIRPEVASLLPGVSLHFLRVRWREASFPPADTALVGS